MAAYWKSVIAVVPESERKSTTTRATGKAKTLYPTARRAASRCSAVVGMLRRITKGVFKGGAGMAIAARCEISSKTLLTTFCFL